jgi:MFS family permease
MAMAEPGKPGLAGRIAFTYPPFIYFQTSRMLVVMAQEMQSVAVGWQVYEITKRPLDLGYVGLAQFLPGILLFLVSGQAADRFDRRKLLTICYGGIALCSGLLLRAALVGVHSVFPIYAVIVLLGVARSFNGPASRALLPQLVPEEHFPNAVAWGATFFQTATIVGPALGGVIYAISRGPAAVYGTAMVTSIAALLLTLRIKPRAITRRREPVNWKFVIAGLRYIWRQKLVLGSISLDLFAMLLGSAVALLPFYAGEILKTGPWGLGLLRCANGIGAGAMAIFIAYRPLRRRAGATMLWCVAAFGAFTVLFGISHSLILSMIALILVGAADMVSVVVRATLVQLATPDEMRGRVNAVDMVFIGASNEIGQLESGFTAHLFGLVPAVVLGGVGAIVVTGLWAWMFPELRKADSLTNLNLK